MDAWADIRGKGPGRAARIPHGEVGGNLRGEHRTEGGPEVRGEVGTLNRGHPGGSVLIVCVENSALGEEHPARAAAGGTRPRTHQGPARAEAGDARPAPRASAEPVRPGRSDTTTPSHRQTPAGKEPCYLVECPICGGQVDHGGSESIAWAWATVHDEVEGHEVGTAYVVRA